MDQLEVKQEISFDAEQGCCSQVDETFTYTVSVNVFEDCQKDEQLFGCGNCLKYFRKSDRAKQCFYGHKVMTCTCKVNSRNESLKSHLPNSTGNHNFECEVCHKTFAKKFRLRRHFSAHTDERPFKCEVCNAAFKHNDNLKVHMRTHSDDRPFKCEVCGAAFGRNYHLKTHMWTHNAERIVERQFKCEVCYAAFSQKRTLKVHDCDAVLVCIHVNV